MRNVMTFISRYHSISVPQVGFIIKYRPVAESICSLRFCKLWDELNWITEFASVLSILRTQICRVSCLIVFTGRFCLLRSTLICWFYWLYRQDYPFLGPFQTYCFSEARLTKCLQRSLSSNRWWKVTWLEKQQNKI